jgi:hypothetical protein
MLRIIDPETTKMTDLAKVSNVPIQNFLPLVVYIGVVSKPTKGTSC